MKIRSFGSRLFFIYLVEKKWHVLKLKVRIHKSHFSVLWTAFISVICHKYPQKLSNIRGYLDVFFFVTQFLSLITLKYHVCLAPSLASHHSIFFTLFVGPIPVTRCSFFFFFFFFNTQTN